MKTNNPNRAHSHCVYTLILILSIFSVITSVSAFEKSCCVLTQKELDDILGINENCPDFYYSMDLAEKCLTCPKGTCRLGNKCICPDRFLDSSASQSGCESTFQKKWPASAGLDDPDHKICTQPEDEPDPSNISCCSLTEDQLWELRGWENCPDYYFVLNLDDKCSKCPPGTCRVNKQCICPDGFLQSSTTIESCRDSFSVSWPESIGREDVSQRSCKNKAQNESTTTTDSDDTNENDSSSSSTSGDDSESLNAPTSGESNGKTSGSNTNVNVGLNSNQEVSTEKSGNDGNQSSGAGLSGLEIAGIVTGIAASVVTVIGGFTLHRKKKNKTAPAVVDA